MKHVDKFLLGVLIYLFIALNTFGYTYHRWANEYYVSSWTGTIDKRAFTTGDRIMASAVCSVLWPGYWIVRIYEPR